MYQRGSPLAIPQPTLGLVVWPSTNFELQSEGVEVGCELRIAIMPESTHYSLRDGMPFPFL